MSEETPLFDLAVPAQAQAPAPKKDKATPKQAVVRTPTGESAQDVVAGWIDWYQGGSGVPVPPRIIARIAKEVRSLILGGFQVNEIKFGLAFWTVEKMNNPMLSPTHLESYVWQIAHNTRPQAQEWKAHMNARVAEFNKGAYRIGGAAPSKAETRRLQNDQALKEYLADEED